MAKVDFNLTKKLKVKNMDLTFQFKDDGTVTITGDLGKIIKVLSSEEGMPEKDLKSLLRDRNFFKQMISEMKTDEIKQALEMGTFTKPQRIEIATTLCEGVNKMIINLKNNSVSFFGGKYSGYAEKNSMLASVFQGYVDFLIEDITSTPTFN